MASGNREANRSRYARTSATSLRQSAGSIERSDWSVCGLTSSPRVSRFSGRGSRPIGEATASARGAPPPPPPRPPRGGGRRGGDGGAEAHAVPPVARLVHERGDLAPAAAEDDGRDRHPARILGAG